jgi:hypothetical protein
MKYFGYIMLFVLGLGVFGLVGRAVRVAMLPVRVVDRSIETTEGIVDKTLTADNAIYNYEWFKQQKEDIKAIESKIEIAQTSYDSFVASAGPRKDWTFEDKTESARLAAVKQGLQSQYQDMVATYNARSKMANRSIFLDGKIPSVIQLGSNMLR